MENFTPDSNDHEFKTDNNFITDRFDIISYKILEVEKEFESFKGEIEDKEKTFKFCLLGLLMLIIVNLMVFIFRWENEQRREEKKKRI